MGPRSSGDVRAEPQPLDHFCTIGKEGEYHGGEKTNNVSRMTNI